MKQRYFQNQAEEKICPYMLNNPSRDGRCLTWECMAWVRDNDNPRIGYCIRIDAEPEEPIKIIEEKEEVKHGE